MPRLTSHRGRSAQVPLAVGTVVLLLVAGPAAAGVPGGPPTSEPTEYEPGPEDGPPTLDGWDDGDWDVRLSGAYEGSVATGSSELEAVGATALLVRGGELVAATPFQLGLYGPADGVAPAITGSADVSWVYAGDVAVETGRVVLRAGSVSWALENFVMDGQEVPFPPQQFDAENVFPLDVTSTSCGLVEGTWEGDAVQGMMELGGGGGVIDEAAPRRFRAVSEDVDTDWLERAEEVGDRIDALDPLRGGFLGELLLLVQEAESLARDAAGDPCGESFSLGIDAQVQAKLVELLSLPQQPDQLWRVAEVLARCGIRSGPAHMAATAQLGASIDALAPGDVATAVQLLQVANALGDSAAAARLLVRIGDPGGQVPGSWLPGA